MMYGSLPVILKKNWQDPLIEFVLIGNSTDKWIDYWLPHLQIDIDTTLSDRQIENIIQTAFGGAVDPFRLLVIDGITYIIRIRLGIVDGININLDIATKSRRVQFHREKLLKVIV